MKSTATLSATVSSGNAPAAPVSWLIVPMTSGVPVARVAVFGISAASELPAGAHATTETAVSHFVAASPAGVVDGVADFVGADSLHAAPTSAIVSTSGVKSLVKCTRFPPER